MPGTPRHCGDTRFAPRLNCLPLHTLTFSSSTQGTGVPPSLAALSTRNTCRTRPVLCSSSSYGTGVARERGGGAGGAWVHLGAAARGRGDLLLVAGHGTRGELCMIRPCCERCTAAPGVHGASPGPTKQSPDVGSEKQQPLKTLKLSLRKAAYCTIAPFQPSML